MPVFCTLQKLYPQAERIAIFLSASFNNIIHTQFFCDFRNGFSRISVLFNGSAARDSEILNCLQIYKHLIHNTIDEVCIFFILAVIDKRKNSNGFFKFLGLLFYHQ